ncbi:hypothetical protein Pcinc_035324 [Petrolisthes cinctipes]|uniref:C2H2-type domain-containing protein n=1 Tax=Petrolisthes cinctipes TaxID=88211 RepID=A0AAE1BX42_PETCI|nr:hypothetical protein Pcinc_035324 [Petrolisthes cinctipes]
MLEETDVEDVDEVLNVEANGEKEKGKVAQEKNESKVKTNDKRVYCCDECGVLSKNLANLKKHMLTHSGERPFKCSTCPKAFRQQHHLVDHQRTHTGERPFRCDQCGASYVQKSSLNLHKKKHTGIKPYVCKICGYSAYEKIHLKIHMRTHTGEKPYQCEKCGQTFSTSTRLNFHRMIHTGEKRYKCEECGVHFREKVTLEQHRGVHVNLGPFVCSECGQEFSKLAGLSLHRKVHTHKDDYLYVYNKEANEAFKSATFSKSKESSEVQNQSSLREETTDKLTNDNEHTPSSTNETENVSEIQYNIPRSSEEMTDCSLPDKSKVVTMVVSSSISKNTSPQKTQLVNASDLKLQNVKETLVSSLKNHAVDCFSSDVNPDQVRAALESGKIVKTEDGEGKGFFIVLPPALRNEEIMFMSESAQCKSSLLADSHPDSNPVLDHDISSKFCTHNLSIIKEKTQVADSEEELQGSDLCIEVHEEVSEEPSSFSVGINEELRDINALKMKRDIVGNVGRYSQVKKEIHPDGSSLFLWNDELEPLEEVTYIIDEDHQVVCEMCGLGFPNLTALHNHRFNEHNKSVTDSGVSDMCISVKIGEEQDFVVINPSIKDSSNEEGDEKAMRKVVTFEEVSDGHAKHKVLQLTEEDGQIRSRVLLETPASEVQIKLEEKTDTDVSGAPSGDQNNKVDVDYNGMDDIKQDKDESGKEVDENHTFHWSDLLEKEKINREKKNMWSTYINNEGKKIWQCEVCNRLFLQSSNLHCHMRMHTGEKPYKCNVCSRAFRQITHLKDHMSRHTGIRPHQCSACGSLFSQRSAATRHIKLAHQGVKDAVVIRNTQPQVNAVEININHTRYCVITKEAVGELRRPPIKS